LIATATGRAAGPGRIGAVVEPVVWLSDIEQQLWRRLLSVECRLRERLDRDLQAGEQLTLGEYEVLVHLSEAPDRALRMSDLAARLLLSRSGLTRRVDGLVRDGLVARRPCDDDGRGALAQLTPAGLTVLQRAAPLHVTGIRRYLIDPIRDAEGAKGLGGLAGGLARIEHALEQG
jgi:DNA-binding MarR family transcriptional regulator